MGPWVTESMRERWARLDRKFAMDRMAMSLEFSGEDLEEVTQAAEDKIQIVSDICADPEL